MISWFLGSSFGPKVDQVCTDDILKLKPDPQRNLHTQRTQGSKLAKKTRNQNDSHTRHLTLDRQQHAVPLYPGSICKRGHVGEPWKYTA